MSFQGVWRGLFLQKHTLITILLITVLHISSLCLGGYPNDSGGVPVTFTRTSTFFFIHHKAVNEVQHVSISVCWPTIREVTALEYSEVYNASHNGAV